MESIGIVGLGYVGLPLAAAFASVGHRVTGLDLNRYKIAQLEDSGRPDFYELGVEETIRRHRDLLHFTSDYSEMMRDCDAVFVTVGTEMRSDGTPNMDSVNSCRDLLSPHLRRGQLIVLKSTVPTGTTRAFARDLEATSGLTADEDFFVAYWPERTIEGHALHELGMLPKIIGGLGDRSSRMLEPIVRHLGGRPIVVSSPELAEMCKLADNSYRAVNIAFANEIGSVCEAIGLDAKELVAAINEGYERTSLFQSGLGAGGPCLSKDPPVLAGSAIALGIETPVVTASIGSNIEATLRIATVVETYIRQNGIVNPHIALIGLAFKGVPETDDARGSPASIIHRRLIESCPEASFAYHDPLIASFLGAEVSKSLTETLQGSDVALFLTNHVTLQGISSSLIEAANPKADMLLVDCWHNIADPHALVDAGKQVFRVGDGSL